MFMHWNEPADQFATGIRSYLGSQEKKTLECKRGITEIYMQHRIQKIKMLVWKYFKDKGLYF